MDLQNWLEVPIAGTDTDNFEKINQVIEVIHTNIGVVEALSSYAASLIAGERGKDRLRRIMYVKSNEKLFIIGFMIPKIGGRISI